jgi:hypothetical protein
MASSMTLGLLISTGRNSHRNHQHFFSQEEYFSGRGNQRLTVVSDGETIHTAYENK